MPLRKREVEIFPGNLFDLSPSEPWWVAHTRSRQEKAFARRLLEDGTAFYVPQRQKTVIRAGRKLTSYLPLFPGYVFFCGSLVQRAAALRSRLLAGILEVPDQAVLRQELCALRELQESGANLVPLEELHPGDSVRVAEGPFQGYSGIVLREQTRLRLVVSISMLRKTVAVEFDREVLASQPVPRRPRVSERTAVA
jgi:transcription antitermination factor NusG